MKEHQQLLHLLKTYSYKRGTFTLASGKTSDFYIDCKQTFLKRDGLWRAVQALQMLVKEFNAQAIAGEGVGGIPLASALCLYSGLLGHALSDLVIVRKASKDHGTLQKVEHAAPGGTMVVLVEDVLTTGGSAVRAVEAIRAAKLDPVAVVALVDRLEGADKALAKAGVERRVVFTKHDFIPEELSCA